MHAQISPTKNAERHISWMISASENVPMLSTQAWRTDVFFQIISNSSFICALNTSPINGLGKCDIHVFFRYGLLLFDYYLSRELAWKSTFSGKQTLIIIDCWIIIWRSYQILYWLNHIEKLSAEVKPNKNKVISKLIRSLLFVSYGFYLV